VDVPPSAALDLGSGGGVPGLVLAFRWRSARMVLLDAHERRTDFLRHAVAALGLGDRVAVHRARAEDAGREPQLRHRFDVVTARSFGPPAVTAECGAPFLDTGGVLLVAEPPGAPDERWPGPALRDLGLRSDGVVRAGGAGVRRLVVIRRVSAAFPRAVGVPGKRPLFHVEQART
jgi:16S rRNA (guanine527-N7)-methyltransferase